jgi:hypothetical protein
LSAGKTKAHLESAITLAELLRASNVVVGARQRRVLEGWIAKWTAARDKIDGKIDFSVDAPRE